MVVVIETTAVFNNVRMTINAKINRSSDFFYTNIYIRVNVSDKNISDVVGLLII